MSAVLPAAITHEGVTTCEGIACSLFDRMQSPVPGRSSLIPPNLKDFFFFPQERKLFLGDRNVKDQQNSMGYGREARKQESA